MFLNLPHGFLDQWKREHEQVEVMLAHRKTERVSEKDGATSDSEPLDYGTAPVLACNEGHTPKVRRQLSSTTVSGESPRQVSAARPPAIEGILSVY